MRFTKLFTIAPKSQANSLKMNQEIDGIYLGLNALDTDVQNRYTKDEVTELIQNVAVTKDVLTGDSLPTGLFLNGQQFFLQTADNILIEYVFNAATEQWQLVADMDRIYKDISELDRNVYELSLQNYYDGKLSPVQGIQYDGFSDTTKTSIVKTYAPSNLAAGATTITVANVTGFNVNRMVSIFDENNYEERRITAIDTTNKIITLDSALTYPYPKATIARTSSIIDTQNRALRVGSTFGVGTINITTPIIVVNSNYDISGNQKKSVVLDNGLELITSFDVTNKIHYIHALDNNGQTPRQICYVSAATLQAGASLSTDGTYAFLTIPDNNSRVLMYRFDPSFQVNVNLFGTSAQTVSDAGYSLIEHTTTTVDPVGQVIWVGISGRKSNYASNTNVVVVKGTVGVGGAVVWDIPAQIPIVTTDHKQQPYITLKPDNNPIVIYRNYSAGTGRTSIFVSYYTGAAWVFDKLVSNPTGVQQFPTIMTKKFGSNTGRIFVAWTAGVQVAYSDDGGSTWSAVISVAATSGLNYTNLIQDINGNVYVVYEDGTNVLYQKADNGSTTFAAATTLDAGTNPNVPEKILDMSVPLTFYKSSNTIKFKGVAQAQNSKPVKKTVYFSKRETYPMAHAAAKLWFTRNITTSTTLLTATAANANSIVVADKTNFASGDTIEVVEGSKRERVTISSIDTNTFTVSPALVSTYSTSAKVERVHAIPKIFMGSTTENETFENMVFERSIANADGTVEDTYSYKKPAGGTDVTVKIEQTRNVTSIDPQVKKCGLALSA